MEIKKLCAIVVGTLVTLTGCIIQTSDSGSSGTGVVAPTTYLYSLIYHFEESRTAKALDSSGEGVDAEIFGASRVKGQIGKALEIPDYDSFVQITVGNNSRLDFSDSQMTVDAWIKYEDPESSQIHANQVIGDGLGGSSFRLIMTGGCPQLIVGTVSAVDPVVQCQEPLTLGTWNYVAAVATGSEAKLYVNGELESVNPMIRTTDKSSVEAGRRGSLGMRYILAMNRQ